LLSLVERVAEADEVDQLLVIRVSDCPIGGIDGRVLAADAARFVGEDSFAIFEVVGIH